MFVVPRCHCQVSPVTGVSASVRLALIAAPRVGVVSLIVTLPGWSAVLATAPVGSEMTILPGPWASL